MARDPNRSLACFFSIAGFLPSQAEYLEWFGFFCKRLSGKALLINFFSGQANL